MRIKEKPVTQKRALAGATVLGPDLRLPASRREISTSVVYEPPRLWICYNSPERLRHVLSFRSPRCLVYRVNKTGESACL